MTTPQAQVDQAGTNAWDSSPHNGVFGALDGVVKQWSAESAAQSSITKNATTLAGDNQALPLPSMGNPNYASQTSEQLHAAVTAAQASDPMDASNAWNDLGNKLANLSTDLSKAASTASSGWEGDAANNALQFHSQVAGWVNNAAAGAQVTSANTYNQSAAVSNAQNSMPTPYSYTMAQAVQDVMTAPDPITAVSTAQDNLNKAAQNQQQAAHVANTYHSSLSQASEKMPALSTTPSFSNPLGGAGSGTGAGGTASAGRSGSGGGGNGFSPHLSGGSGAGGSGIGSGHGSGSGGFSPPPSTNSSGPGDNNGSGQNGTTPPSGSDGTGTQGFNPPPGSTTTDPNGPGGTGLNTGTGNGGFVGMPTGGMPASGGFGSGGAGADTYSGGGDAGGGSGGFRGGSGGTGSYGSRSGLGPSGGSASGSGPASGSGARSAAGAAAAEDSAIEGGAAGTRGASGTPAGGMGAGRGQKGGEDKEHKRASYLLENDPDSLFGTDAKTAPPVIGQ